MRDPIPQSAIRNPQSVAAPVLRRLIREGLAALYILCGPLDPLYTMTARMTEAGSSSYAWPVVRRALELVLPDVGPWFSAHAAGAAADHATARDQLAAVRLARHLAPGPPACPRCGGPRSWRAGKAGATCPCCGWKETEG